MNLSKVLGATLIGATLASAGCDKGNTEDAKEERQRHLAENKKWREQRQAKIDESAKAIYPLEKIRHLIHGIHLFDQNKNEVLEPNEIDLFIKVEINSSTNKYTNEGEKRLSDLIALLREKSHFTVYKPEDANSNYLIVDYDYRPNNITKTIQNLETKLEEYKKKHLDQIDSEIQNRIQGTVKNMITK